MKILGFGEVMLRFMPQNNKMLMQSLPGSLDVTFGGAEANVMWNISMLGGNASYITALPDNPLGHACANQLRSIGVDISGIVFDNGRIGTYYVESGANQRASKVVYDRANSSVSKTPFEAYNFEEKLAGVTRVHLTGITPAISETAADACVKLAKLAHSKGIAVSCDLNFRGKLWNWRPSKNARELAREIMPKILEHADLVIGNEEDAFDVLGIKSGSSNVYLGKLDIEAYKETARKVAKRFACIKKVAFTLRESISATHNNWGAMLFDVSSNSAVLAPTDKDGNYSAYAIRNIIDRVGGGDSFAAGLLYGLDSGEFERDSDALAFAVANSCLCHSVLGDYSFVPKSDVVALMGGAASGRVQR